MKKEYLHKTRCLFKGLYLACKILTSRGIELRYSTGPQCSLG
jgi:hypothetical protein